MTEWAKSSADAVWTGSFQGKGRLRTNEWTTEVSLPKAFGGLGIGATPEDMLLGALTSCYLSTLGIILAKNNIKICDLSAKGELLTVTERPPRIARAHLEVRVVSDADAALIQSLAEKAASWCLIAQAIAGNVEKTTKVEVVNPNHNSVLEKESVQNLSTTV